MVDYLWHTYPIRLEQPTSKLICKLCCAACIGESGKLFALLCSFLIGLLDCLLFQGRLGGRGGFVCSSLCAYTFFACLHGSIESRVAGSICRVWVVPGVRVVAALETN